MQNHEPVSHNFETMSTRFKCFSTPFNNENPKEMETLFFLLGQ